MRFALFASGRCDEEQQQKQEQPQVLRLRAARFAQDDTQKRGWRGVANEPTYAMRLFSLMTSFTGCYQDILYIWQYFWLVEVRDVLEADWGAGSACGVRCPGEPWRVGERIGDNALIDTLWKIEGSNCVYRY
jgi:hypothetical protein